MNFSTETPKFKTISSLDRLVLLLIINKGFNEQDILADIDKYKKEYNPALKKTQEEYVVDRLREDYLGIRI